MVRQSRTLKKEKGILAKRKEKEGKSIPADVIKQMQDFYQSDEVSQMCPGIKDFVTVKIDCIKQHKYKRLLLCNLNELHANFRQKFGQKTSLLKFCELYHKWCVTVESSSGIHSVCVCVQHQNAKLISDSWVNQS